MRRTRRQSLAFPRLAWAIPPRRKRQKRLINIDVGTQISGKLDYIEGGVSRDHGVRFVARPLAGQVFYLLAVDATNRTFRVYDPDGTVAASIANGDTFIGYIHIHPDSFQAAMDGSSAGGGFMGSVWGARNIVLEGGLYQGSEYQFWFLSARGYYGRGNLSITGTAGTLAGITKTVSGSSFASGRTTITFSDGNPIPTFGANLRNTTPVRFLAGALAGQDFPIYTTAAGTYSITLQASAGNLTGSIAVGDTLAPWMLNVGDFVTFKNLAATVANRYEYRQVMSMSGPLSFTLDAAFPGPVSAETNWVYVKNIRDVAIVNSRGQPAAVSDTYSSQFCCGFTNMLVAQNTNLQQILLRNNIADGTNPPIGFGIKDATFVDNIFKSSSYDIAFSSSPPRGTTIDNNLYREADGLGGTNASANVTIALDANLRPTSGLTKTMGLNPLTGKPQIPFAADGATLTGSAVVGALQP